METILEHYKKEYSKDERNLIEKIRTTYNLYDFIATLICERNHFNEAEINDYIQGTTRPKSFKGLKDIDTAVTLIVETMATHGKIRIVGDYDVDGVTSTYVLLTVFEALGYTEISHYLPLREKDGYGLNTSIVENAYRDHVQLLITVDNGISAYEGVEYAKELGLIVIVTDHHELPLVLPPADAIINPHQKDCLYPYKSLAGVGIAYKLGQALLSHFKLKPSPELIYRIQGLVALGTVCDVAPLIGENRHLVKTGLIALNKGALPAASIINQRLSVGTLGFQVGPRLNACGRLESAETALHFLQCQNINDLIPFKQRLDQLNQSRQDEENHSLERVLNQVEQLSSIPDIIIQVDEEAHESIVGLVAGKIREKYYRPTVIFAKTIHGTYKGSGRSIEEYDMFQHFKPFLHLLDGGGGHPMACGLKATSLEQILAFKEAVNQTSNLSSYDKTPKIYVDKCIDNAYTYDFDSLEKQLCLFLPTGAGNSAPIILIKDASLKFYTKYAKNYRISEVIADFGAKTITSTLWNDFSLPEDGDYVGDIALQVGETGWQIKSIYFN